MPKSSQQQAKTDFDSGGIP